MPLARVCSECGASLAGRPPHAKTCGQSCRQKRARRTRREARESREYDNAPEHVKTISMMATRAAHDDVKTVVREELRPIVREALTEDVLRAISTMLGLTTRAVELLQADLEDEDSTVRQRAYSLLFKYTAGHPALLNSDDTDGSKQIVVNFALDRPAAQEIADAEAEVTEMRTCDLCDTEKPATEFVGSSERCSACQAEWKQRIIDSVA